MSMQAASFSEDTCSFFQNPAMGWSVYIEDCYADIPGKRVYRSAAFQGGGGLTAEQYWDAYDRICEQGGLFPSVLYIRMPWFWYEPCEGQYLWQEEGSSLKLLEQGAKKRGLKLAFRILLDATDSCHPAVPDWVFAAGAKKCRKYPGKRSRFPDAPINDPVFLQKIDCFLQAFAKEYDNPDKTAYMDAQGVGSWGEVHGLCYDPDISDGQTAVEAVMALYQKHFAHVLLGAQAGGEGGYPYGAANGFVTRRDSFGSPVWLPDEDKEEIIGLFHGGGCVYAESCYHGLVHALGNAGSWQKVNKITGWPLSKVLGRVLSDALECRSNVLDYRTLSDMECWALDAPQATAAFLRCGGYRLMPVDIRWEERTQAGGCLRVEHAWKNTAVGRLPNACHGWDYKYKTAFALFAEEEGHLLCLWKTQAEPSDWILEKGACRYCSVLRIPEELPPGEYRIGCGIVNTQKEDDPEIRLAVKNVKRNRKGWYLFGRVTVMGR